MHTGHTFLKTDFAGYLDLLRRQAEADKATVPPLTSIADGADVAARVDHGRWIVQCPDCQGAAMVWPDQPLYLCRGCWNAMVGGRWRRVSLPTNRDEIEAALAIRPLEKTRHWRPGESVMDLWRENSDHGLLVLPGR